MPAFTDTYKRKSEADAERAGFRRLLLALGAARSSLRLDSCGAWHLKGSRGLIYSDGKTGWILYASCGSVRQWTEIKKRLAFLKLTQDGDEEGCFHARELPSAGQAAVIRKAIGLRARPEKQGGSGARIDEKVLTTA